jgi:predicted MPP superfamily phosphohydrolase
MGEARQGGRKAWPRSIAILLALAVAGVAVIKAVHDTLGAPFVREQIVPLPGLSPAAGPVRVLLMSDIHVAAPEMTPERLTRIVAQMNQLHPDIIMIAGDFISDKTFSTHHYPLKQALAPLAGLHARWGTVAVLGNHDYLRGVPETRSALEALGIRVLRNEATRIGPLTVGGLGDLSYGDVVLPATLYAMRHLGPPYVLLAHEPDTFNDLPSTVPLMLTGHTHCGQIVPPLIGPIITGSAFGQRYVCGLVREHASTLIVTGGLGTSDLPVRLGAHGDVWLITLTPAPLAP